MNRLAVLAALIFLASSTLHADSITTIVDTISWNTVTLDETFNWGADTQMIVPNTIHFSTTGLSFTPLPSIGTANGELFLVDENRDFLSVYMPPTPAGNGIFDLESNTPEGYTEANPISVSVVDTSVVATPEPATFLLFGSGLLAVIGPRRLKKKFNLLFRSPAET